MKITIIYSIFLILLTGCTQIEPTTAKKDKLKDVSYSVDEDGDVKLTKTYKDKEGKSTQKVESVSKPSNKKGYEDIPDFTRNNIKDVTLKQNREKREAKIMVNRGMVKVSVESIPVDEFIDLMFGSVLKLNYTATKEVRGIKNPITLNMSEEQSKQEVFEIVSKLLSFEGIDIKRESGTLFISAGKEVEIKTEDTHIGYGRKIGKNISDDKQIIQLVPYKYITPRRAIEFINFSGIDTTHVSYRFPSDNIGMLKGKAGDVRKAINIIELVDRPYLEGKIPVLIQLENIESDSFSKQMKEIFNVNGVPVTDKPSGLGIVLSVIPDINSLLVISPKQEWIDMLMFWKNKLDNKSKLSPNPRFYTYKVKNRKADELAEALNAIVDMKFSKKSSTIVKNSSKTQGSKAKSSAKTNAMDTTNYSIQADLPTNTLMMQMLPAEYRELLPIIDTLDALPLQVLTEVTLAEVTLTDTFSLGFEHALKNNTALGASALTATSSAALTAAFGGTGFGATYSSKNLDTVMNSFAEDKLLSILSKPKILILNNETGNINVGTQIPIITSETSADDIGGSTPTINRNITYQNTGVQVGLSPTINSNGILTMSITLTLSEAQLNDTSGIDSPLIVNRTLSTALTLKNGETVMLGGLISKNKSTTDGGVPLLMDIPFLGSLFQSQSEKIVKTELIMLIRPSIIQTPVEMSEKTRKYRSLLKMLDKYSLF